MGIFFSSQHACSSLLVIRGYFLNELGRFGTKGQVLVEEEQVLVEEDNEEEEEEVEEGREM